MWDELLGCLAGIVLLIVVVILAVGITNNDDASTVIEQRTTLRRTVDAEAGVVCWSRDEGGLSCLPIDQTLLNQPEIGD